LLDLSRLSVLLLSENHIFNYATDYAYKNPTILPAGEFKLSEADFLEFKAYIIKQELKYTTASEELLSKMKEIAEKEGFSKDIEVEYNNMMSKVIPSKERDLEKYKEEICQMLENEIVSRYYFQKGRTIDSFRNDEAIKKALSLFENSSNYNTILKK